MKNNIFDEFDNNCLPKLSNYQELLYVKYLQLTYIQKLCRESYDTQIKQYEGELNNLLQTKINLLEKITELKIEIVKLTNLEIIDGKLSILLKFINECEKELNDFNTDVLPNLINNINFSVDRLKLPDNIVNDQTDLWKNVDETIKVLADINKSLDLKTNLIKEYNLNLRELIKVINLKKTELNEEFKIIEEEEKSILFRKIVNIFEKKQNQNVETLNNLFNKIKVYKCNNHIMNDDGNKRSDLHFNINTNNTITNK